MTDKDGQTTLFHQSDRGVLCAMIDAGADVNMTDTCSNEKTALFHAVQQSNNDSVVHALIDAAADVNITDDQGKITLFYAVQQSNSESVVHALIDAGADVNRTDSDGNTALCYAVQQSNSESVVRALIDAGADVNRTDSDGKTALFYAVINDSISVVHTLVEYGGAFVDARDFYGRTPLFFAITKSLRSAHFLLANGGNMHVRDIFNVNILSFCFDECLLNTMRLSFSSPMFDCLDFFMCHGVRRKAVLEAVINILFCKSTLLTTSVNYSKTFTEALNLAKGYVPKLFGSKQRVIKKLMVMVMKNETAKKSSVSVIPDIMDELVKLGANPNSADSEGNTALHYATCLPFYGVSEEAVMGILLKLEYFGVSYNTKNNKSETPLLFCLSKDVREIAHQHKQWSGIKVLVKVCKFLLEHGSSVDEIPQSETPIFHLILELVQELLQMHYTLEMNELLTETITLFQVFLNVNVVRIGVSVNRKDVHLSSPLHKWAALTLKTVEMYTQALVKDFTFDNFLGVILKQFLACGAKLNDRNENEETPLHQCKTWTAAKLLIDTGANANDVDSSGRSPLLAAANNKTFLDSPGSFFPDVLLEPNEFWETALDKGLDPWEVDKRGESVLSILIESKQFKLAKALVEIACNNKYVQSDRIAVLLLNAVCKDKSTSTYWKVNLVENILRSRKSLIKTSSPLNFCCKNIIQSVNDLDTVGIGIQHKTSKVESKHDITEPLLKKTKTNESGLRDDLKAKDSLSDKIKATVHWDIAKLLLLFGFHPGTVDETGQSCLDIAEACPALKDLLLMPIDIGTIPLVIPWASFSPVHKHILAKVARGQESINVGPFWYHQDHLARGSFGAVFAGINEKDGREVAIKRIEKLRMERPEDKREIVNLAHLADCEKIVRYLSFCEDSHFFYIILELMDGNVNEFLQKNISSEIKAKLCQDVVTGLKYLHDQNILHRDLKPANILYKTFPKLHLKIADFGLSRCIDSIGSTSVYGSNVGTRCWIAPEILTSITSHSKSSDVFACGLVLHYILSIKRHPFSPGGCTMKSTMQTNYETEANIINGKMEGWDDSLSPEATNLIKNMLNSDESKRPGADEALVYPFFWSKKKKLDLLIAVGNQPEFKCPRAKRSAPLTAVETDLETKFTTIVKYANWNDPGYLHMPYIYTEMKKRKYDTNSVVELVRFIRNASVHHSECIRPTLLRKLVLEDIVFLEYFPALVTEVLKAVINHGWDQTREEIKYALLM